MFLKSKSTQVYIRFGLNFAPGEAPPPVSPLKEPKSKAASLVKHILVENQLPSEDEVIILVVANSKRKMRRTVTKMREDLGERKEIEMGTIQQLISDIKDPWRCELRDYPGRPICCWINKDGLRYPLSEIECRLWARFIKDRRASIDRPSLNIMASLFKNKKKKENEREKKESERKKESLPTIISTPTPTMNFMLP